MAGTLQDKKNRFFEKLIENAQGESPACVLIAEPRLDGAMRFNGTIADDGKYDIVVYTHDPKTAEWLEKATNPAFRRSQYIPLSDNAPAKFLLNKEALGIAGNKTWPEELQPLVNRNDAFGAHRPFIFIKPIPSPNKLLVAPLATEEEDAPPQILLLVTVPFTKFGESVDALRANGLLRRKENDVADYTLQMIHGSASAVIAVRLPQAIGDSLLASSAPIETLMNQPPQSSEDLINHAASLPLPEKEQTNGGFRKIKTPKQTPKPESNESLSVLASRRDAIKDMGLKVATRILPNGNTEHGLVTGNKTNMSPLLEGLSNPLKISHGQRTAKDESQPFYALTPSELARLEGIVGELPKLANLGLHEKPIKNLFESKKLAKNKVVRVLFAEERIPAHDSRYYIYVAANQKSFLSEVGEKLGIGIESHAYLSSATDKPGLIRIPVPKATWDSALAIFTKRTASDRNSRTTSIPFEKLDENYSSQALDEEARNKSGLSKSEPKVTADKDKPEKVTLDGADAEQFFINRLRQIAGATFAIGFVERTRKDEAPSITPMLYVRAAGNVLGAFKNALSDETTMFREGTEMRFLSGAPQGSAGAAIWEFNLTPDMLATLTTQEPTIESINSPDTPLHSKERKHTIDQHFRSKEEVKAERDIKAKSLKQLRILPLVRVQIDKPNAERLASMQQEIEALTPALRLLAAPLQSFEQQDVALLETLKNLKALNPDEDIAQQLRRERALIAKTHTALSEGTLATLQAKIDALQRNYAELEKRGVHTQYLCALDNVTQRELKLLIPEYIQEMAPCGDYGQLTRLLLTPSGEQAIKRRSALLGSIDSVVPFDELNQITSQQFDNEISQMHRDHAVSVHVKTPQRPEAESPPLAMVSATEHTGKGPTKTRALSTQEALRSVHGFITLEQQESSDDNIPVQEAIAPQHVLVLSAATQKDIDAIQRLKQSLENDGYLLPTPQFYGEITRGIPRTKREESLPKHAELREAIEEKINALEIVTSIIALVRLNAEQWALPESDRQNKTPLESLTRQLTALKIELEPYANDFEFRSILRNQKASLPDINTMLESITTLPPESTAAVNAIVSKMGSLNSLFIAFKKSLGEKLEYLPKEKKEKSAHTSSSEFVISVINGTPEYYPADGRAGSARVDIQLPIWRQRLLQIDGEQKPTLALKLYLTEDGAAAVATFASNQRTGNLRNRITPDAPLSPTSVNTFASALGDTRLAR